MQPETSLGDRYGAYHAHGAQIESSEISPMVSTKSAAKKAYLSASSHFEIAKQIANLE